MSGSNNAGKQPLSWHDQQEHAIHSSYSSAGNDSHGQGPRHSQGGGASHHGSHSHLAAPYEDDEGGLRRRRYVIVHTYFLAGNEVLT